MRSWSVVVNGRRRLALMSVGKIGKSINQLNQDSQNQDGRGHLSVRLLGKQSFAILESLELFWVVIVDLRLLKIDCTCHVTGVVAKFKPQLAFSIRQVFLISH